MSLLGYLPETIKMLLSKHNTKEIVGVISDDGILFYKGERLLYKAKPEVIESSKKHMIIEAGNSRIVDTAPSDYYYKTESLQFHIYYV